MYFQIIIHSQYFNAICIFKTPFTCENDLIQLQQTRMGNVLTMENTFWKKKTKTKNKQTTPYNYKSETSIGIFETVPQIEKSAMLGFKSGLSNYNNKTSRQ